MTDSTDALYQQLLYAIPATHSHYFELVALVLEQRSDDVYSVAE